MSTASSIILYNNSECKANEFIEDNKCGLYKDGTVRYVQFVENSSSIKLDSTAFYVSELLERTVVYLTDESDIYLIDELGNKLTTIF